MRKTLLACRLQSLLTQQPLAKLNFSKLNVPLNQYTITNDHIAQLIGYLRTTHVENGLLINFGAPRLYIKKYIFTMNDDYSPDSPNYS
jgi:hypothetical protein